MKKKIEKQSFKDIMKLYYDIVYADIKRKQKSFSELYEKTLDKLKKM